ncbi:SUMO1 sentrin specific peptidase 8 [Lecanora helva]
MASPAEKPNDDVGKPEDVDGTQVSGSGTADNSKPSSPSPATLKRSSTTPTVPHLSAASSTANSPRPSREGSPTRPQLKASVTANAKATRSRKNSQDLSPIRAPSASSTSIPTVPSAASIQRALSAAGTPYLPSAAKQDPSLDAPQPQKNNKPAPGKIPRLSSPPPAASSGSNKSVLNKARKFDQTQSTPTTPTIVVDRPARGATFTSDSDGGEEDLQMKSGSRTPVRGPSGSAPALETVQESSLPSTPAITAGRSGQAAKPTPNNDRPARIEENPMEEAFEKETQSRQESGNESTGKKNGDNKKTGEGKETKKPATAPNSAKPPTVTSKRSFTQLPFTKAPKTPAEGSVKNMTVETETVSSVPQVPLGGGPAERHGLGRTDTGGSLRPKPSSETIRPKKERKKVVRKAPSLNAGNGGSYRRHFHHRPTLTRPPSLECLIPLPVSPPYSVYDDMAARTPQSALLPGNSKDQEGTSSRPNINPTNPHGARRRSSSSVLIPFRGRTASTKADIFEAKIANAVNETNSSDSEETFVYESNPPEPHSARPNRFHSRTPSAASTVSHYENQGARGRQDGHHSIVGKKSMKFANNYNPMNYANDEGTIRGPGHHSRHSGNTTPHHHHHIGRYGRGGHASLFDNESPFSNTTKSAQSAAGHLSRLSPRHSSPRNSNIIHVTKSPRKAEEFMSYDLEGEGADDERTPLIGSNRIGRNRRRPLPGSVRQMYADDKANRCCGRGTAWATLGIILALIIAAMVTVVTLCSKPLVDVRVKDIRNVLASEQEIMLDLHVGAINPNLITIQVSDLDVNIFAKSKHVGTNELWRSHQPHNESPDHPPKPGKVRINSHHSPPIINDPSDIVSQLDGIDEGTDPIDDPAADSQTMLLGQIFEFDSPLIFGPSPVHHNSLSSMGEVRLARPGNKTEDGGSQRWEHVVQHDFELIVRGVIRYSLPVTSKMYRASIAGRVVVHPTEDVDDSGSMKLSKPTWPLEPGSNVLLSPSKSKYRQSDTRI